MHFPLLMFRKCSASVICVMSTEEELRKLREETNVETLKQELERERCRRVDLEQKMNDVLKARWAQSSNMHRYIHMHN